MIPGTEFKRVIPEEGPAAQNPSRVQKLIFCSGKVYYDLKKKRAEKGMENEIAIARVEQVRKSLVGIGFHNFEMNVILILIFPLADFTVPIRFS